MEPKRTSEIDGQAPLKKRRLIGGKEIVFRQPGEGSEDEQDHDTSATRDVRGEVVQMEAPVAPVLDTPRIIIHEDD